MGIIAAYGEMIRITDNISIGEDEIHEEFVRSSGPGGQNVNKVSTAVQLRFDLAGSPSIPDDIRRRIISLAGKRVTKEGVLIIKASRYRSQEQNREDAISRLVSLIEKAAVVPKTRRKTRPTRASNAKRLEEKRHRRGVKQSRKSVSTDENG